MCAPYFGLPRVHLAGLFVRDLNSQRAYRMAVGELAESSCVLLQFKRSFKRNDKPICQALCLFIAHLVISR